MTLELRYHTPVPSTPFAAFIRGADAAGWLQEINRWALPATALSCYILPQSIRNLVPAGLFVIFDPASVAQTGSLDLQAPYTCIGGRLYIPADASLWPPTTPDELKSMLPWELQVFHPISGLVGFESADRVELADLFAYPAPIGADWSFAHPGLPARPQLNSIQVIRPTAEQLMDAIKETIGQKPLEEIPVKPEHQTTLLGKLADQIKYSLLKGILGAGHAIGKLLPEGNATPGGRAGILQKLVNWMEQNLEALQQKRNNEIERLLNLFDEDTGEALQYAIPLNSPYLDRGSAPPSGTLSRRSTQFNLSQLGGGRAADGWDLSNYYNDLRSKYLNAAQQEIDRKDFKKAAYVYAHLLGDYSGAANVLQQGGLYREAATVYKDHLKNIPLAAECLEKGGLYHEAIELYKDLDRDEKIGDLYTILRQEEPAREYYEKHIDKKLFHKDALDAARVIDEKLHQNDRAREVLLNGWTGIYQHETCLRKYFDIAPHRESGHTEKELRAIYAGQTPAHKRISFLNVLEYLHKKKENAALAGASLDIAYDIIHQEATAGNGSALHQLKKFLPADKLVGADTSRYLAGAALKPANDKTSVFHLDQSITWTNAAWHRNQFLVLGMKEGFLQMARGNWYGNFEYYSWSIAIKPYTRFTIIDAPYYSNQVFIHSANEPPVTRKNLPKNKYFTESLLVYCPIFLHKGSRQFVVLEDKTICRLEVVNGDMTLVYYSMEGDIKKSIHCRFEQEQSSLSFDPAQPLLIHKDGYYYTYYHKHFLTISEQGSVHLFDLDTIIRLYVSSHLFNHFYIIISTNRGCFLARPANGQLNPGPVFAPELTPSHITVLSENLFVMAEKTKATLFEITDDHPQAIKTFNTHAKIIGVLPTSSRYQFGLLEETGRITLCDTTIA